MIENREEFLKAGMISIFPNPGKLEALITILKDIAGINNTVKV